MNRIHSRFNFRPGVLALAALAAMAACAPAMADDNKLLEGAVSVGIGLLNGEPADRGISGQYSPFDKQRTAGVTLGVDYNLRDEEKGAWVSFRGANLLGDTRELGLVWKHPGDWKFTADYSELVHRDPNTVKTGLLGAGTTKPQSVVVVPGSGSDLDLSTKRSGLSLGFAKILSPELQFEASVKREVKDGGRMFGIGMTCPSVIAPGCLIGTGIATGTALLMVPEPIDASHSQVEARLSYAIDKFRVNAGYYGSFYRNGNPSMLVGVPSSLYNPLGTLLPLSTGLQAILSQPVALAPDNQSHQFDVSGSYDFTGTTRGTFKLAYSKASQNDDFASAGLTGAPAGVSSLNAQVNTTLAKLGVTSRPIPQLSLSADLRFDDRDDRTPLAMYNLDGTSKFTNRSLPNRKVQGKVQANWQFDADYRGTLAAEAESIDRGVFTSSTSVTGISALRQKTEENGVRAELRRRMADNFSGSIVLSTSKRDGSNWLRPNSGTGVTEIANPADPANTFLLSSIFMPTLADRQRDKVKLFADWQPTEALSLQFSVEDGRDAYTTLTQYGLSGTHMNQVSVDWGYAVNDNWNLNGYLSRGTQTLNQSRFAGYVMAFGNTSTGLGIGVTGKLASNFEVGGTLSYTDDRSAYNQTLDLYAGPDSAALLNATGGLPDVTFRQSALKLYGKYTVDKKTSWLFDLVYQRARTTDWSWSAYGVPFTYSDGSVVTQRQNQAIGFIGVTYQRQFP